MADKAYNFPEFFVIELDDGELVRLPTKALTEDRAAELYEQHRSRVKNRRGNERVNMWNPAPPEPSAMDAAVPLLRAATNDPTFNGVAGALADPAVQKFASQLSVGANNKEPAAQAAAPAHKPFAPTTPPAETEPLTVAPSAPQPSAPAPVKSKPASVSPAPAAPKSDPIAEIAAQRTAAVDQMEAAEADKARELQEIAAQKVAVETEAAKKQAELAKTFAAERDRDERELRRVSELFAQTQTTVDPDRWWASRNTGQKILAAIGVALGGVGGGANQALGVIQNAIDNDIEAQKATIAGTMEKRGQDVANRRNILAAMKERFSDDTQALSAARLASLRMVEAKLEGAAAKHDGLKRNAEFMQLRAGIQAEAMKERQAWDAAATDQALKRAQMANLYSEARARNAAAGAKQGGRDLPAGEAAAFGDADSAKRALEDIWDAWKKKVDTGPLGGATSGYLQYQPGTDAARYNDQRDQVAQIIGRYMEGGKLTDSDYPRYVNMLPTPGDGKERAAAKIINLKRLLETKAEQSRKSLEAAGFRTGRPPNPSAEDLEPSARAD